VRCYPFSMRRFYLFEPMLFAIIAFATSSANAKASYSSGYTGRPPSESCGNCHGGGTAPTISLTGPDTLNAGQTGDYTAVVSGGPNTKTFGAAVDGTAAINPVGTNMKDASGEVFSTHDNGASITFKFSVVAPTNAASFNLYYMALASNGSGTGGDGNVQMKKSIAVAGATITDAGVSPTDSGTTISDAGNPAVDAGTHASGNDGGGTIAPSPTESDDIGESTRADGGAAGGEMKTGDGILPESSSSSCAFAPSTNYFSPSLLLLAGAAVAKFTRRQRGRSN